MTDIRKLINQIASEEAQLTETRFIAPCVGGGRVRTRVAGMVYTFVPKPANFEGWGIFQPVDEKKAAVVEEADLPEIEAYLAHFPAVRLWLAYQLKGKTWLGYPMNESDARQRVGVAKPVAVHLVTDGGKFEPVVARSDGKSWWFETQDRKADPMATEEMKRLFKKLTPPDELKFKGMTPEMRVVYQLVAQQTADFTKKALQQRDEKRLRKALRQGGGELVDFQDKSGDYWLVEWTTANGERHSSAIAKTDLTVISAGICLSGFDRHFDLQSLVGVVEER